MFLLKRFLLHFWQIPYEATKIQNVWPQMKKDLYKELFYKGLPT